MIWNGKYETMGREDLAQVQIERLQSTLNRARRNVAFARQAFERAGREGRGGAAARRPRVACPSPPGPTCGRPTPTTCSPCPCATSSASSAPPAPRAGPWWSATPRNDVRTWSECVARVLAAGGVTEHDVVQVAYTYGLFSGGLGFHYGAESIGASVVPASTGSLERQVMIMRDFKTSALACTPGYALALAGALADAGIEPGEPEPPRGILRRRALERGAARAARVAPAASARWTPTASPRCSGPGVAFECEAAPGPARERGPLHRRGRSTR